MLDLKGDAPTQPPSSPGDRLRNLHSRGLLLPIVVALVVLAVLVAGAFHEEPEARSVTTAAPESQPTETPPPAPEIQLLRPDLEKTPLSYSADYWSQLARKTEAGLVRIGPHGATGVVIQPGLVVSSIRAVEASLDAPEPDAADDLDPHGRADGATRVLAVDTALGLALLELTDPDSATPFAAPDPPNPSGGSFIAAVGLARRAGVRIVPGHLVSSHRPEGADGVAALDATLDLPGLWDAAAIVDLDGGLLGVAIGNGDKVRLLPYDAVARVAARLLVNPICWSIEVAALEPAVAELLGAQSGVAVERVRSSAFVPSPSIQPGDILLRWARENVTNPNQFATLYAQQEAGSAVSYAVLRGGRRIVGRTIMPGSDCRPVAHQSQHFPRLGLLLRWRAADEPRALGAGWEVLDIGSEKPAAAGGLMRGDRIVSIAGRKLSRKDARRALDRYEQRPQPMLVEAWRGNRLKLIAIPAAEESE